MILNDKFYRREYYMAKKSITKFPEGFFQQKRPILNASEVLKDLKPFEWEGVIDFDDEKTKKTKNKLRKNKNVRS